MSGERLRGRQTPKTYPRRQLLRVALWAGGAASLVGAGIAASGRFERKNPTEAEPQFRKQIVVPRYELTSPQELIDGGWLEPTELKPEFATKSAEDIANFYLNLVTERMLEVTFPPFPETAKTLVDRFYKGGNPENGDIRLAVLQFNPKTEGLFVFRGMADVSQNQTWHQLLLANAVWMDPRNRYADPEISKLWIPVNTALSLVHEVLGHYRLNETLIPFFIKEGLHIKEGVDRTNRYFGQEPFAYAVSSEAIRPLLGFPGIENVLLKSHLQIAREWERYRNLPGNWYHPGWVSFINSFVKPTSARH